MDYQSLKASIEQAPFTSRIVLDRLLLFVSAGNRVLPEFTPYLDGATSYQDFFNALYSDDAQKFTPAWAEWAALKHKSWLPRFAPQLAIENLRLKSDGVPVQFGTGLFLAPTGSRDSIASFYVFKQGAFNAQAAQFVTSLGGSFTCVGYDFAGIYGIYYYCGAVVLEEWEADREPTPSERS
ncbi:MAG: hypothetical protein RR842_09310 [Gordonibacter sp.]|uniref:hypothetical protein n=2 Tax=Gordonibacter sp. TaxID=1968902 RepID=UPI002FCA53DB